MVRDTLNDRETLACAFNRLSALSVKSARRICVLIVFPPMIIRSKSMQGHRTISEDYSSPPVPIYVLNFFSLIEKWAVTALFAVTARCTLWVDHLTALRFFCSTQITVMPTADTISRSHHSHNLLLSPVCGPLGTSGVSTPSYTMMKSEK